MYEFQQCKLCVGGEFLADSQFTIEAAFHKLISLDKNSMKYGL